MRMYKFDILVLLGSLCLVGEALSSSQNRSKTISPRYAASYDGKEIQPRQMHFFHWLFGDHVNQKPRNETEAVDRDHDPLFPQNRTKASTGEILTPIDWEVVLKELVNPRRSQPETVQKVVITASPENKIHPHPDTTDPVYDGNRITNIRGNANEVSNKSNITSSEVEKTSNSSRGGRQIYTQYVRIPVRKNIDWALINRGIVGQHYSKDMLYKQRNRPVYNIYNEDEESNGFDDTNDEYYDSQAEYFEMLPVPVRHLSLYQNFNGLGSPGFNRNRIVKKAASIGGLKGSIARNPNPTLPLVQRKVRTPNGFRGHFDDYEHEADSSENEPVDFQDDVDSVEEAHVEDGPSPEYIVQDDFMPDKFVRRSLADVGRPWGRNCQGSQCKRQGELGITPPTNASAPGTTTNATTPSPLLINSTSALLNSSSVLTTVSTPTIPPIAASNISSSVTTPTLPSISSTPGLTISSSTTVTPTPSVPAGSSSTSTARPSASTNSSTSVNLTTTPSTATNTTAIPTSNTLASASNSSAVNSTETTTIAPNNITETTTEKPLPPISTTLTCQCGVQSVTGGTVGSTTVRVMSNPWLVEIHSRNSHLCGGTLVNNKYVLTSAKCINGKEKKSLLVTAGLQLKKSKTFTVTKVAVHPKFNPATLENDVALLRLSSAITPSPGMRPICLPIRDSGHTPRTGHLVTWVYGNNNGGKKKNLHLLQTEVELLNQTTCQTWVNSAGDNSILSNGTLCATPPGQKRCAGDIGGPLQVYAGKFSYQQIGLVSWSVGCRSNSFPGVYTDIHHYVRWILFQTQDGEYCKEPNTARNYRREFEDLFQFEEQIM